MRNVILKGAVIAAACAGTLLVTAPVQATDWLSLQGTEPAGASSRARIWGFVQPQYTEMDGTSLKAGPWSGQDAIFNVVRPDNDSESTFQLRRARLGVRGTGFPLDSNVNYFLLAEFGDNGITKEGGGSVKLTDASVTLNHLKKYTRLRFGQFKTPGSEDGLQAIHVHNYNNFSLPADGLLLERFRDSDGVAGCNPTTLTAGGSGNELSYLANCSGGNGLNGPVGAYRDIGVQLFNTFSIKDGPGKYPWEVSYAFMVGNGNGITRADNDDNREFYYYASVGQVFGGKGPRRQDWKLYGWYQDGERTIFDSSDADPANWGDDEFDRTRWGVGGTLRYKKYRLYGEYVDADGMIPNGTDGAAVPGSFNNAGTVIATANTRVDDNAEGWYLDFGYKVLPNLELDVRYDELDRATDTAANERNFERWTIGAQYFFNKKSRFTINYEFRDAEASRLSGGATPNTILDEIDDVLTAQVLVIF